MIRRDEIIELSFGDADPAGVVFYPRALALAHQAVENLIRHSSLGWDNWFASPTHAMPVRHAEADFLAPMKAGGKFAVRAAVEEIGATSVVFVVEFRTPDGRTAAQVRTVHVFIDRQSGRPREIPEGIRSALT